MPTESQEPNWLPLILIPVVQPGDPPPPPSIAYHGARADTRALLIRATCYSLNNSTPCPFGYSMFQSSTWAKSPCKPAAAAFPSGSCLRISYWPSPGCRTGQMQRLVAQKENVWGLKKLRDLFASPYWDRFFSTDLRYGRVNNILHYIHFSALWEYHCIKK